MIHNISSKNSIASLLVIGALAFSSASTAQDGAKDLVSGALGGWSGTASLGATTSTGNAETDNINGSIRLSKTAGKWEHLVFGTVFKGSSSIVVNDLDATGAPIIGDNGLPQRSIVRGDTSDRLALGYQPKFYYSAKTYFFGILDWEQDEPSNIDTATRQIIGVGHRFFSSDRAYLSGEIGFGNKNTDQVVGEDLDGGIGYLGLNYLRHINDTISFNADLRSDFGSDNTFVEIGLGLAFKVSDRFAFKIAHFTRNNTDLSSGNNPLASDSDSVTSINLVFDI